MDKDESALSKAVHSTAELERIGQYADIVMDNRGRLSFEFDKHNLKAFMAFLIAQEREACANICDELHNNWKFDDESNSDSGPRSCAAGIRKRSNVKVTGVPTSDATKGDEI